MRTRLVVAAVLAASLGAGVVADAAPRKVCKLLGAGIAPKEVADDPVRITSADIASNGRYLTVAVRVASIADPQAPVVGREFEFYFSRHAELNYLLKARVWGTVVERAALWSTSTPFVDNPQGDTGVYTQRKLADATAVVDTKHNEVRVTIPLATVGLSARSRPATKLVYLGAQTMRVHGVNLGVVPGNPPESVSTTTSNWSYVRGNDKVTYTLGTPSCVPVGK